MLDLINRKPHPSGEHHPPAKEESKNPLLSVEGLSVEFKTSRGSIKAVRDVSFEVAPGEIVALVGESGSGKSVSALSIMGLLPRRKTETRGVVQFGGRNLVGLSEREMRSIRGREISMIFQEPMSSLNPVLTIGLQIRESLQTHLDMSVQAADERALELLSLVGISDAADRLKQYPHQFSGGMRQRIMIAIGLACNPKLIIADEPTTALDVTIQAQILELMKDLSQRLGIALVVITHNLGVVARYADRIYVMYAGGVAEAGPIGPIFKTPRHPYTIGLLRSVPRLDEDTRGKLNAIEGLPPDPSKPISGCSFANRCPFRIPVCDKAPPLAPTDVGTRAACFRSGELADGTLTWQEPGPEPARARMTATKTPLLELDHVSKRFELRRASLFGKPQYVRAVTDLSFAIYPGETLGLVGESGCGKSTVARLVLDLETPSEGEIRYDGQTIRGLEGDQKEKYRRGVQVVFQDPYSSLNPRMTIAQTLEEPMQVHKLVDSAEARRKRVSSLLDQVGLRSDMAERYPHQLSGGQRQRVGIARALALEPKFIVCDEAVSALDVSIQGQVINLLQDLQAELDLTYLFIAHDLAVVRHISTRVAVMYLGRLMEIADKEALYSDPLHPYTKLLLSAAPVPDPEIERRRSGQVAKGELPSPVSPPSGCVFHTRCPMAGPECRQEVPQPREIRPGHFAACIKI